MGALSLDIVPQVIQACEAGAGEAAAAFQRGLGIEVSFAVAKPQSLSPARLPEELQGPGLAVAVSVDDAAALLLLPASSGLIPDWCRHPDVTGQAKLNTLAQELGMTLLPESCFPGDCRAAFVPSLAEAVRLAELPEGMAAVPLGLVRPGSQPGTLWLLWPSARSAAVFEPPAPKPKPTPQPVAQPAPQPVKKPAAPARATPLHAKITVNDLPIYSKSLLRIEVPVMVTLAQKRQSLGRILELGPGSIIQFDKSCDEMLELTVGGRPIAQGEAVKVGDKFGLRITSIILPDERFKTVVPPKDRPPERRGSKIA